MYDFWVGVGVILGLILAVLVVALVMLAVAEVVSNAMIFLKAGEKPWKALIPVYDRYIMFQLVWETKYFIFWAVSLGVCFFGSLGASIYTAVYENSLYFNMGAGYVFFELIAIIGGIALMVFEILLIIKLAKAFNKDTGFTVGLVLLYNIFIIILAFDRSVYKGIKTKTIRLNTECENSDLEHYIDEEGKTWVEADSFCDALKTRVSSEKVEDDVEEVIDEIPEVVTEGEAVEEISEVAVEDVTKEEIKETTEEEIKEDTEEK